MENVPRSVVDVNLTHAGSFHHAVEGGEVFFDEADEVEWIVLHASFRFTEALDTGEVGQEAQGHHLQCLCFEIAKEKPVGPDFVEVLVKFSDLGDGVDFVGVIVPTINDKLECAHHRGQLRAYW